MSTPKSELCRKTIRKTPQRRAANAPEASVIAEATVGILQQMAARIAPLIGERGAGVLFKRSLHLTRASLPGLVRFEGYEDTDNATLFANLKASLDGLETKAAREASHALLETFTKLLTALIGESLTERLLNPAREPAPSASAQKAKTCPTK